MYRLHSHQPIAWILQGCSIFSSEDSLPCCLSYHFAFNGRRWPESFWTHSSNWFLGPVEPRIVSYLFIYLILLTLSLSSSSPLFYQDRWVWCVFILHFASFSASQPVWSSRGVRIIVQWKYIFLSSVRIGRAHLASNQCLMVTLGDGEADLIQSISNRQKRLEEVRPMQLSLFPDPHVETGVSLVDNKVDNN